MNQRVRTDTLSSGSWLRVVVNWLVLALVVACNTPAQAQLPAADEFSTRDAIALRLEAVQAELSGADASADSALRELLKQHEAALYQHLEAIDNLERIDRERHDMRTAVRNWSGFDQPPPYSIIFVDKLRAERKSLERQQQATKSRQRIINRAIEDTTGRLSASQATERQYKEKAEFTEAGEKLRELQQAVRDEALASRILAETIARLRLRQASHVVQDEAITAALELNSLQLNAVRGQAAFTAEEFQVILERITEERSALLELVRARGAGEAGGPQVTWKIEFLGLEKEFWSQLYKAMNSDSQAERKEAVERIHALKAMVDDWADAIRLRTRETTEQTQTAIGEATTQDDLLRVIRLQEQVSFAIEDLADQGARGKSLLELVVDGALAIWDFELYLAEESTSVGGYKVTTYRQVTLGKLLRLAFMLVAGWLILRFVSRGARALVARRPGASEATADAVGSWIFGLGMVLLVIVALNRVHIPFTAFAFLGGTLAIGIGFGAQTLLKNFISGMILSLERPFKIGDFIEVEGITGHIQRIGMRASVIRHLDGIDTLIPNSMMLENRVSNWTLGDSTLRGEITVGVAYGTRFRDVTHTLLDVAKEHGLVLDKPEPNVYFDEFGDNALVFKLLYWFDPSKVLRESLASDLRFMVGRAFVNAGIVISFPQRDIHFDDDKPLRIELSRSAKPAVNKDRLP